MWFKHRTWIPVAWLLAAGNLLGALFAARTGESWHATIHLALVAGFTVGARHLMTRRSYARGDLHRALDDNERLQDVIETMQPQMEELEERVAIAERLLAEHRERDRDHAEG